MSEMQNTVKSGNTSRRLELAFVADGLALATSLGAEALYDLMEVGALFASLRGRLGLESQNDCHWFFEHNGMALNELLRLYYGPNIQNHCLWDKNDPLCVGANNRQLVITLVAELIIHNELFADELPFEEIDAKLGKRPTLRLVAG